MFNYQPKCRQNIQIIRIVKGAWNRQLYWRDEEKHNQLAAVRCLAKTSWVKSTRRCDIRHLGANKKQVPPPTHRYKSNWGCRNRHLYQTAKMARPLKKLATYFSKMLGSNSKWRRPLDPNQDHHHQLINWPWKPQSNCNLIIYSDFLISQFLMINNL